MTEAAFLNAFGLFLMALMRFGAFFINTPVFSDTFIPNQNKAAIAALSALLLLPSLVMTQKMPSLSIMGYGVMAVKEIALGFAMGYMVLIITAILRFAGGIIGMQIGFSFVQVADPSSNQSLGLISEFFQLAGTLTFLVINGHLIMFNAFFQSFALIPPAKATMNGGILQELIAHSNMVFTCGLQLAMPIIAIILMGDVALGIISRTVPKMNVFQLSFAVKIVIGMLLIVKMFPILSDIIRHLLKLSLDKSEFLIKAIGFLVQGGAS